MHSFELIIIALGFVFIARRVWIQRRLALPPGPKGWPIIGNILDVPKQNGHLAYVEMGRRYESDLLYLNVLGVSILVINSAEAANDLLVGRLSYANRPRSIMLGELMGWNFAFTSLDYGDQWRKSRALFTQQFSPSSLKMYQKPCLQEGMYVFLNSLLDSPKEFANHLRLLTGGTILSSAYGIPVNDPHDPYLELSERVVHAASEVSVPLGKYLVDLFPILKHVPKWFPGAEFKRKAAYERGFVERMINQPFEFVKRNMANGTAKSSIASRALQQMQDDGSWSEEEDTLLKGVLGSIYVAGADTTSTALNTILLALVLNPDILRRGQAAVDAAIGPDRLPNFHDEHKIPYVDALVMEGLRWRPVVPLGLPHCTANVDVYKGYHIPANTIVMGNSWAILHDTNVYGKDVDRFRPERFLNQDGTLNSMPYPDAAFGFGRRVCPGKTLAQSAAWLAVASLLACFNFDKVLDKNGVAVEPSTDYIDGLFLFPHPYECTITPRSKAVENMIRLNFERQISDSQ